MKIFFFILFLIQGTLTFGQNSFRSTYGNEGDDFGRDIIQTSDGNYVVVGSTNSFEENSTEIYVLKIDQEGNQIWGKRFGEGTINWGKGILEGPEGNLFITGYSNGGENGYDGFLAKLSPTGEVYWQKFYGGSDWDFFEDLVLLPDNTFLLCGESFSGSSGHADGWLLQTDTEGNLIREAKFGSETHESLYNIAVNEEGEIALHGTVSSSSNSEDGDMMTMLLDENWEIIWNVVQELPGHDFGGGLSFNAAGSVIIGGTAGEGFYGQKDMFLAILSHEDGSVIYSRYGGGILDDNFYSLAIAQNQEIILVGSSNSFGEGLFDALAYRFTPDGSFNGESIQYGLAQMDILYDIALTNDGGYILVGESNSFTTNYQVYVIKVDEFNHAEGTHQNFSDPFSNISEEELSNIVVYPNPASDEVTIETPDSGTLTIYTVEGKIVLQMPLNGKVNTITTGELPPGLYNFHFLFQENQVWKKVLKLNP